MVRHRLSLCAVAWEYAMEPLLRYWPGYPPDWERRRMMVFERAFGRCQRCGVPAGRIQWCEDRWRVTGGHVHHVIAIAAGGRHHLHNLQLLCVSCHRQAHPENAELGARYRRNSVAASNR